MAETKKKSKDVKELNIYQKLAEIREIADYAKKTLEGYKYKYVDIVEILAKVTSGMSTYNVSLVPSITPGTAYVRQNIITNTKIDKQGKSYDVVTTEMLMTADMVFRWVNNDNPEEYIDVPWYVTGSMADPAQAMGAGLTYAQRQFLTSFFQIAQSESDIDAYRSKQKLAEEAEDKAIAEEIVKKFDTKLRMFLTDHPDKSDEVKKFIARYAKRGNYLNIKDPELAAKLMKDFDNAYTEAKGE